MSKKNREKNNDVKKSVNEMTDKEFVYNLEPTTEAIYLDYMSAPSMNDISVDGYLSNKQVSVVSANAKIKIKSPADEKNGNKEKGYVKTEPSEKITVKYIIQPRHTSVQYVIKPEQTPVRYIIQTEKGTESHVVPSEASAVNAVRKKRESDVTVKKPKERVVRYIIPSGSTALSCVIPPEKIGTNDPAFANKRRNVQATPTTAKKPSQTPQKGSQTKKNDSQNETKAILGFRHKKRAVCLALILIFAFVAIAAAVLGSFEIANVSGYLKIYKVGDGGLRIVDPILGLANKLGLNIKSGYGVYFDQASEAYDNLPVYSVSCCLILYFICMIVMLIKAIVALADKADGNGLYKKRAFGMISLIALLCALVAVVGGINIGGLKVNDFVSFIAGSNPEFCVGYGMYALLAVPVITLICSCFAYKKVK